MARIFRKYKWPLAIFAAAFLVRLIYLIQYRSNPAFYHPMVDELWHIQWARAITGGDFWGNGAYFRGPLYPYLLALFLKIAGDSLFWTRVIQAAIASCSAVLVYYLGRKFFDHKIGLIAGFGYAFYATLIFYETMFLIPVVYIPLILLAVFLLKRDEERRGLVRWLLPGLIIGLAGIARPNILLIVPLVIIWIFLTARDLPSGRRIMRAAVYFLGVLVPVLAVTVRNVAVTGEFILISSQGGVNLYIGNNPDTDGLTMLMPEIDINESLPWSEFTHATRKAAEKMAGKELTAAQESSFWTKRALDFIVHSPIRFVGLTLKKFLYFMVGFENSDNADIYYARNYSWLYSLLIWQRPIYFPLGLVMPLAIIGMIMGWKNRKRLALLYIFALGYIPTVVLFLVTARHRLPIIPFLLLFASLAVVEIYRLIKHKNTARLIAWGIPLILLLIFLNRTYFDLGFQNLSQIHFNQAIAYERQGNLIRAEQEYREALKDNPGSPVVLNNLGYTQYRLGKYREALENFEEAARIDPRYARAYNNAGLVLEAIGQPDSAIKQYRKAINTDPDLYQAYINLGNLYSSQGELIQAEVAFLQAKEINPDSPEAYFRLGSLYGQNREYEKAEEMFVKGSRLGEPSGADYVNWGNIYFSEGEPNEAIKAYRKGIEKDPDEIQAYFNLALTFYRYGFPRDSALSYARKALQLNPNYEPSRRLIEEITGGGAR